MALKINSLLQQKSYFLFLLPVFFILHEYNQLFGYIKPEIAIISFAIVTVTTLIIAFLFGLIFKLRRKSSILAFLFTLLILTYGSLHDFLKGNSPYILISRHSFLLPFLLLCIIIFLIYIKRSTNTFKRAYLFLNTLLLLLLITEVGVFVYKSLNNPASIDERFTVLHQFERQRSNNNINKPDIFFLVFDAMPSTIAMQEAWDFDNSQLDSFLRTEKFYIASHAKSNYNITLLSVTSCLNMEYLLPEQIYTGGKVSMIEKASAALLKNSTTEILRKEDYNVYQFQPLSNNNKQWKGSLYFADIMINHFWLKTLPGRVYEDLGQHVDHINAIKWAKDRARELEHRTQKENFTFTINQIQKTCLDSISPKFVYGHFMLPHGPYIFDSIGRMVIDYPLLQRDTNDIKLFINQVKYATTVIKELVCFIKNNNRKNTVIVIQGDHGYRNIYGHEYMIFDNLNAIYYPDYEYSQLNSKHSPINTFRYIFSKFFMTNLPAQKDTSIYIPYSLKKKN